MFDDLAPGDGSGVIGPRTTADTQDPARAAGADGVVLQFPVQIEVRMVAQHDPEELVKATLDRLTAALRGLA